MKICTHSLYTVCEEKEETSDHFTGRYCMPMARYSLLWSIPHGSRRNLQLFYSVQEPQRGFRDTHWAALHWPQCWLAIVAHHKGKGKREAVSE